jgi:hypothetical protein
LENLEKIHPDFNPIALLPPVISSETPRNEFVKLYGLWFMVYGLWFMVYGLWFMVYGL